VTPSTGTARQLPSMKSRKAGIADGAGEAPYCAGWGAVFGVGLAFGFAGRFAPSGRQRT
jgi:hypothetical protein